MLKAPFDSAGCQRYPIGIIQFPRDAEGIYIQRPILRCALHPSADVAVGVAAPMHKRDGTALTNPVLALSIDPPGLNARVVTFAYPKHANVILERVQSIHFTPAWYDGEIKEY